MPDLPARQVVSTVTSACSSWRCLVLFQSWSQFQSWIFFVVLTCLTLRFASFALGADEIPVGGIVIGAVFGSMWSVVSVIPARFTVSPASRATVCALSDELQTLNYITAETRGSVTVYRQNLFRFLRWDEGNVQIRVDTDLITVTGAQVIVRRLHRKIDNADDSANVTG